MRSPSARTAATRGSSPGSRSARTCSSRDRSGGYGRQDRDPQPPDRRPGLLRAAGDAVLLQPERVEPAARRRDRRAVQRADEGRTPLPQHGHATQFVPYDPASPPPAASIEQTTTDAGKTSRSSCSASRALPTAASTRSPCSSTRRSRSSRGRRASRGAGSSSTRSAARAEPARSDRARKRAAGGAARRRLRRRDVEPQHLREQLQRPDLRRGDDDDEGDRRRALRAAALHDGERRLGGVDAAAPPRRELPRPPRRA